MVNKKIIVIFVCMLMISTTLFVRFNETLTVKADTGEGGESGESISSLNDYVWGQLLNISDVVNLADYHNNIPKGRAWATAGENYTIDSILIPQLDQFCGENNTEKLLIDYIPLSYEPGTLIPKKYSSKIVINDYNLTVNSEEEIPFENPIPYSELFPMGIGTKSIFGNNLDKTFEFDDLQIREENLFSLKSFSETYGDDYYNITNHPLNDYDTFYGYALYIQQNESIPDEQDGAVFILNETSGCEDKINNITDDAFGCILIDDPLIGYEYQNASQKYFPISEINITDNNLTNILDEINNGSIFFVDNRDDNETLIFSNLSNETRCNWVAVIKRSAPSIAGNAYYDFIRLIAFQVINQFLGCKAVILSDFDNHHFMTHTVRGWKWFMPSYGNRWYIPTFSVNEEVGDWLIENESSATVSGFIEQEYKKQTILNPGVESYNVVSYLNKNEDPNDNVVVLSNRIDGWWGETPGDSGTGCAILLGIIKYFSDYDIEPKHNLRFLFTTGEEYGMKGAQHYSDSHENDNIIRWIGLDQLGFDYTLSSDKLVLNLQVLNNTTKKIVSMIANDTRYAERTDYELNPIIPSEYGSEDYVFSQRDNCDTICIVKDEDSNWDGYHRSGSNYTKGDALSNTDRNDVNLTLELAWNITKYFTVFPDCWFNITNYEITDSSDDGDPLNDSIQVDFDIETEIPHDLVMIKAYIKNSSTDEVVSTSWTNYTVTPEGTEGTIFLTLPEEETKGEYYAYLELYNSTGRINESLQLSENNFDDTDISSSFYLNPYETNILPDSPSDPTPTNSSIGISTNPTLSTYVSDQNGYISEASFYRWESTDFTIDSESDWNEGSFDNTTTDGDGVLELEREIIDFGNGSDGDITISGNTAMSGDVNCWNLTIDPGVTLDTAGYTIKVLGTLTNHGTITDSYSGGEGGESKSGGLGQDPLLQEGGPSDEPGNGSAGNSGEDPRGGASGASGAGGGGSQATALWNNYDANGGDGGASGAGGHGGGNVIIYANNLDNQGTIQADGDDGENGEDGQDGEYYSWGIPAKDLAGGGGGAGSGGDGGDGGYVEITYNNSINLSIENIHANGGDGGTGGTGGSGHLCNYAAGPLFNWEKYPGGEGGEGGYGDGGNGEYNQSYYSGDGQNGNDGSNGETGTCIITDRRYVTFGQYYSTIYDAGDIVNWKTAEFNPIFVIKSETKIERTLGENTSGDWVYHSNFSNIPDSRWVRIRINLSTTNVSKTPSLGSVVLYYGGFLLDNIADVENDSYINYTWSDLSADTPYSWRVGVSDYVSTTYGPLWTFTTGHGPDISNITATPDPVGFGFDVTINATVFSNVSDIDEVKVRIGQPGGRQSNNTMTNTGGDFYEYLFNETWVKGQYNYSIWAIDDEGNQNESSVYDFDVSADATIDVATLQDTYGAGEYINITDPPTPPEEYYLTDRGLDYNKYYNAISGNDVLEIFTGPVNYLEGDEWNPINNTLEVLDQQHPAYAYGYRAGNEKGLYSTYFKPNIQDEWPVAFAYDRLEDPTTDVLRTKLVGVGYLDPTQNWDYEYLQGVLDSQGYIEDYSAIYEDIFTGTDVKWSYGNSGMKEEIILGEDARTMLENNPPSSYGLSNDDSYLVFITRLDYQNLEMHDSSGALQGNFTLTDAGIDFKDALGHFKCALPLGDAYELENELNRTKLTYRIIQYNGNNYLLSGLKLSDLEEMQFPVVIDPTIEITAEYEDGHILKGGSTYSTVQSASSGTVYDDGLSLYIGQRYNILGKYLYELYRSYVFFNTSQIPENCVVTNTTLSLNLNGDYSTTDFDVVIQNGQPIFPRYPLESGDYNKNYYTGNGGSFNTSSVTNGYNNITLADNSWVNTEGMTKFCIRSSRDISATTPTGSEYIKVDSRDALFGYAPKLTIEYRNQSKIKNTGETNISGYLLIQVQYNDSGDWIVDDDTINETTPRTINSSDQLALDLIFNGEVSTSDLTNGDGQYRVYAAFRDPDGEPLICDDESALEAWYEFEVNTS